MLHENDDDDVGSSKHLKPNCTMRGDRLKKTELYAVVMGWFWGEVSIPENVDGGHSGCVMMDVVDRRRDLQT